LRIGCCFTDLGKATNALDAKLGCICIVFKMKMPTTNQLQNDQLNTQPILCAYGTRVLLSFFCGSLLVILKKMPVNWIYGVIGILYSHLQSC
jgi:hypothetical protein